jgi:hypothetical protein
MILVQRIQLADGQTSRTQKHSLIGFFVNNLDRYLAVFKYIIAKKMLYD